MLAGDTDIYQPIEKELKITRGILEVLAAHNHPVALITKSALITRDLDILAPMAEKGLVSVAISFTTLDRHLARTMEPRCAAPHRRLDTMRQLVAAGIPVTAMTAPIIPALNDPELESLLEAAADAAPHAQAMSCCACRWRLQTCSRNGSKRTTPTARRK